MLEIAETEIRQLVKNEYLKNTPRQKIDVMVKKLIAEVVKKIKIPNLRTASVKSLIRFYNAQYNTLKSLFNGDSTAFMAVVLLNSQNASKQEKTRAMQSLASKSVNPIVLKTVFVTVLSFRLFMTVE